MSLTSEQNLVEGHLVVKATSGVTRLFDLCFAAIALLCLSPLLVAIALAIKVTDPGDAFHSQTRMGKNFLPFRLFKFRTMVPGADRAGSITGPADARITRIGALLRRYKLDELPQLWNVLRGDMQLVGPRPEVQEYVEMFRPQYSQLLQDRPGITDPASLAFRHEEKMLQPGRLEQQYLQEILPAKLSLALDYQQQRSFGKNLQILLRTAMALIS